MNPVQNPYRPGAGLRPPELAGRDDSLDDFNVLLQKAEERRPGQGIVLAGLRGVGKTVLLNEFARRARNRGWIVANLEARRDTGDAAAPFRAHLANALAGSLREVTGSWGAIDRLKRAAGAIRSFSIGFQPLPTFSFEIEPASGVGDSGDLELDLTELARSLSEAAIDRGVGVLIAVDEMQDLDLPDLRALCGAVHASGQRDFPFYIVGAGLPNLPGRLAEARSYSERLFRYKPIAALDWTASEDAIVVPAKNEGVHWDEEAVRRIFDAADGYPYFLQEFAKASWEHAKESITLHDADAGIQAGFALLDAGFFSSRWIRATPSERLYLIAMSEAGDEPGYASEVATRLGRKMTSLGPVRANLISKGLVYAPEHGQIAFTVPGMARFIERQRVTESA